MPDRVTWIRVLIAELQRLSSHLVWLGTHGMEIGAISVMMYCFREREQLLNLNEMLAGFRMFPSYLRIGGLREDLPRGFHAGRQGVPRQVSRQARRVREAAHEEPRVDQAARRASASSRAKTTLGDGPRRADRARGRAFPTTSARRFRT